MRKQVGNCRLAFLWFVFMLFMGASAVWDTVGMSTAGATISKSIDVYANFPSRVEDLLIGNNSRHWANTSVIISPYTRTVYQCCNGFMLGADGMQEYSHGPNNRTNSWGQAAYVAAGKRVIVNIDPRINATVSASDVCQAALARKEKYAQELLKIAEREKISGFITDWEDATGNNMTCFNHLFGYVSSVLRPKGLSMSMSMDNSNHQAPMDLNSTQPWSAEWDWLGAVHWGSVLVDMGTYPGGWSRGLSYPAAQYLESFPCPKYPNKTCGIKGQVEDMLTHKVNPNGQLSPGLGPYACSPSGTTTQNGWTKEALTEFLIFLDQKRVRTVTLWFSSALQLYKDSFTCPWFVPALLEWAKRP